jgi:nucleotide-binding universal stress UspA family protein
LHLKAVDIMAKASKNRLIHPAAILVATDLSDLHRLMPFAIQMAFEAGARLQLLHVVSKSVEFTTDPSGMPYYDREGALSCAANMLDPWRERARKLGVQCDMVVREGSPVHEIITAARQFLPDRLLLGTRSLSRLGKLFLGSVAEQVLRSVNLPVFTVGPEALLATNESSCQQAVLIATTLEGCHQAHATLAYQIAANQKARLILVNVLPPGWSSVMDSTISYEMQQLAKRICDGSSNGVDILVVHGNPALEILAAAEANHASLIVMGTSDRSLLHNITHDRTICRVLAHARCPILTLHGAVADVLESHADVAPGSQLSTSCVSAGG